MDSIIARAAFCIEAMLTRCQKPSLYPTDTDYVTVRDTVTARFIRKTQRFTQAYLAN